MYSAIYEISVYTASSEFKELKKKTTDIKMVDSLYFYAIRLTDGDIEEALLALTFALLPYNHIPIVTPVVGISFSIPLPSVTGELFMQKRANLPSKLLPDSPESKFGDKDKLSHFFGSAWLSYTIIYFDLTKLFGYFIEVFEETFKVDGTFDPRDVQVNRLGKLFGNSLRDSANVLPSEILLNYIQIKQ